MTSPENILLCSADDDNPVIKVVDLGLPELVKYSCAPQDILLHVVIRRHFVLGQIHGCSHAPQNILQHVVGVILYILLSDVSPFNSKD